MLNKKRVRRILIVVLLVFVALYWKDVIHGFIDGFKDGVTGSETK